MNCKKYQKEIKNPLLKRLSQEKGVLSAEVKELSQDLLMLTQMLKNKENDLNAINKKFIQKTLRGPFLSVVESTRNPEKSAELRVNNVMRATSLTCVK